MESTSAGTHAIAVGFPEQHHFAFDAQHGRLAEIWKGRFLNAQSTWFDRFAPPAIPLGSDRITFPMSSFKTRNSDGTYRVIEPNELRFRGYRLNKIGVPTFSYTVAEFEIEDQIKPVSNGGLSRKLTITPSNLTKRSNSEQIAFVVVGDIVKSNAAGVYAARSNLKVTITDGSEPLRHSTDSSELLILIPRRQCSFEVRYQW